MTKNATPKAARQKKPAAMQILWVLIGALLLFCISSIALLAVDIASVNGNLESMKAAVKSGDFEAAASETQALSTSCKNVENLLNSPFWSALGVIPPVNDEIDSGRQTIRIASDLTNNVLQPLMDSLSGVSIDGLLGSDHSINISLLDPAIATIQKVAPEMDRCASDLKNITAFRIAPLNDVLKATQEKIATYNDLLQKTALLAPIVSEVFGSHESQTFLLAAQNSAETRSAGGFPGAIGTLSISNGKIDLGKFATPYELFSESTPHSVTITEAEIELFDAVRITKPRDVNFNPDFPRVASIWATDYEQTNGQAIDGVISVVPSVVQKLLAVSGPITLSDGTVLDGDNATRILQHDMYWQYLSKKNHSLKNAEIIDGLFAEAAQLAFDRFFSSLNASNIISATKVFLESLNNREIMLWFKEQYPEERILAAGYGGALNSNPAKPQLGVFASISISSKLGWYLDIDTEIGAETQNPDGTVTYPIVSKFSNVATDLEVETGGAYIMGSGSYRPVGDMSLYIYIFAPAGGSISDFKTTANQEFKEGVYNGLEVKYIHHLDLNADSEISCSYNITVSKDAKEPLTITTVPTLTEYR